MRTVYEAANTLEAHMLLDLLQQQGFDARIEGAALQGAAGELPAGGLVRVVVADEQVFAARAFVKRWDAQQPRESGDGRPVDKASLYKGLMIGLVVGVLATWAVFRAPSVKDGLDYDRDGKADETWTYALSGKLVKSDVDRNRDTKIDWIGYYDKRGLVERTEQDEDFNGSFETRAQFVDNSMQLQEADTDGDGFFDLRLRYQDGVQIATDYIHPNTGHPYRTEILKLGKTVEAWIDTNGDNVIDTTVRYSPRGDEIERKPRPTP